jgi:hypothetical protein
MCNIFIYVSIDLSTLFSAEDVKDPVDDLLCLRPLLLVDMLSISCLRSAMLERNLALIFFMYCNIVGHLFQGAVHRTNFFL